MELIKIIVIGGLMVFGSIALFIFLLCLWAACQADPDDMP